MIQQQTIDGRKATVAYLTDNFEPADKDSATLLKVMFDGGDVHFVTSPDRPKMTIDILQQELDHNLPHWLKKTKSATPPALSDDRRKAIRAKHRAAYWAARKKPATPETMARGQALYESIKAKDPAFHSDTVAEASAFNRHRRHRRPPPDTYTEGADEATAWAKHRMNHQVPLVIVVEVPADILPDTGATDVADIPVKLQLVAWAKAIMVLDASEILIRDLIERDLSGHTGAAVSLRAGMQAIPIANRLVAKIKDIRYDAIKTAFRLLRTRLGDVKVLDHSLPVWAQTFAKNDIETIRSAITSALLDGLDNTEIARRVVGSMALNGVDGVTEYTRHKIAHLGRAAIKAYNLRNAGIPS